MTGEKLIQVWMNATEAADLDARVADSIYTTRAAYVRAILQDGVPSMNDEVRESISRRKAVKQFNAGNVDDAVETWSAAGCKSGQEKLADDIRSWATWFFRAGEMTSSAGITFGGSTCLSDLVRRANANMSGDRPRVISPGAVIDIVQGGAFNVSTGETRQSGGWNGDGNSGLRYESPRFLRAALNGLSDVMPLVADTFAKVLFF